MDVVIEIISFYVWDIILKQIDKEIVEREFSSNNDIVITLSKV